MALKEQAKTDKIEIVGDYGHIQVRTVTEIIDDATGEVKASSNHRDVVMCDDTVKAAALGVTEYANIAWTPQRKANWAKEKAKLKNPK